MECFNNSFWTFDNFCFVMLDFFVDLVFVLRLLPFFCFRIDPFFLVVLRVDASESVVISLSIAPDDPSCTHPRLQGYQAWTV